MNTALLLAQSALVVAAAAAPAGTVVEPRAVGPFDAIVMRGAGELALRQGAKESLAVIAEPRLMPQIVTTVRDGTLYLELRDTVSTQYPLRFEVTARTLRSIRNEGSGNVATGLLRGNRLEISIAGSGGARIDGFQGHDLASRISGAGDVEVGGGSSDRQSVSVTGSGQYHSPELDVAVSSVSISGSGDVELRARERLDVEIAGSGTVRYHGNPAVRKSIAGAGEVTRVGR